jgi:hypothetical protein
VDAPPAVAITYLVNDGTVPRGSTITIQASASDVDCSIYEVDCNAVAIDDRGLTAISATVRAITSR